MTTNMTDSTNPTNITIIVSYKSQITQANISTISSLGAIRRTISSINALIATIPFNNLSQIRKDPDVKSVELDSTVSILGFLSDPITTHNYEPLSQNLPWGVEKILAPRVWETGNKGYGINIAILDTGAGPHEDLIISGGYNFLNDSENTDDDNGHGTHVAGTIAATNNEIGVVGVAPEAQIFILKVLDTNGSGTYSDIISAINWCIEHGIDIISMSFGGGAFSQAFQDICDAAHAANIILVAAGGNNNGDGSSNTVTYPAKFNSVLAVAATDADDTRATFSSCGAEIELSAPGVAIPSTVPTNPNIKYGDASGYKTLSGTSMACPHVSGTVALVLVGMGNKQTESINAVVRKTLAVTSIDLGGTGRDIFYGYGRIDAKKATDYTPPEPDPNPQLVEISITPQKGNVNTDKTIELTATAFDDDYSPISGIDIVWETKNDLGYINPTKGTTVENGTTSTTFTAGNFSGICIVSASCGSISAQSMITIEKSISIRYSCREIRDDQGNLLLKYCAYDPRGEFTDIMECIKKCQKASKLYSYSPTVDENNKLIGLSIIQSQDGTYSSDQMCQIACAELKRIDSQSVRRTRKWNA